MLHADPTAVSQRAKKRGLPQVHNKGSACECAALLNPNAKQYLAMRI